MEFICRNPGAACAADQSWKGSVRSIEKGMDLMVAEISGKGSRMVAIIGNYIHGNYICIPDWGVGSPLASLNDRFWNREHLERYLSRPDAITISEALHAIYKEGMA